MKIQIRTKYTPKGDYEIFNVGMYYDKSPALKIFNMNGEPQLTVTVCIDHAKPAAGNVFVKDYSENEGVMDALIAANILKEAIGTHISGFVTIYECPMTTAFLKSGAYTAEEADQATTNAKTS